LANTSELDGNESDKAGTEGVRGIFSHVDGADEVNIDAVLNISISEVLANGMLATGNFNVSDVSDDSSVTAGLSGDFGSLTIGTFGIDDTYKGGDVGGVVSASTDTDHAITYHGTWGDVEVGIAQQTSETGTTQAFATMDFQGIKMGLGTTRPRGADGKRENVLGASYTIDGLTLKVGRETDEDTVTTASYSNTFGDVFISAEVNTKMANTLLATYTMGDLSITAKTEQTAEKLTELDEDGSAELYTERKIPRDVKNTLSAVYKSGDLSVSASSDHSMAISLDMGNADLVLERVAAVEGTKTSDTGSKTRSALPISKLIAIE
jgi:hypothetical protein